jgi:deoxycytidylate deaminase
MKEKFVRKYMKMAKVLADENDACYSRKIGVIIVSADNRIISAGYNGSATGCFNNDSPHWLSFIWDNLLSEDDKANLYLNHEIEFKEQFVEKLSYSKTCPRRFLNIPSGQRMEICAPCVHAERNAIYSAARQGVSVKDGDIVCYCAVPCSDCSLAIIQSGIKNIYCLKSDLPDYSIASRNLLEQANVHLHLINESEIV